MKTLGVGVVVFKGGSILLGLRGPKARWGSGCLSCPGGMIDPGESSLDACRREVKEETGLTVALPTRNAYGELPLLAFTDHYPRKDHATLWVPALYAGGEPENKEPGKIEDWSWHALDDLVEMSLLWNPDSEQHQWLPMPHLCRWILRFADPGGMSGFPLISKLFPRSLGDRRLRGVVGFTKEKDSDGDHA